MERFNLLKMAEEEGEKARLEGDEYWEDAISETIYYFKSDSFELENLKYKKVESYEDYQDKGCSSISLLFLREDGKYFALDEYIYDEYGYHDTQPKFLTEVDVEVKEIVTVTYSYTIKEG